MSLILRHCSHIQFCVLPLIWWPTSLKPSQNTKEDHQSGTISTTMRRLKTYNNNINPIVNTKSMNIMKTKIWNNINLQEYCHIQIMIWMSLEVQTLHWKATAEDYFFSSSSFDVLSSSFFSWVWTTCIMQ